jgi:acetyl-CoA carboxylase carboxyl transferase subunit alpha
VNRPVAVESPELTWRVVEVARHPRRPYALDYILRMAPNFMELRGDRLTGDDPALVAGVGSWHGRTAMFFGQQKGRTHRERVARNYGMMHPEGYRKAMRLARQAAKMGFPIVSFIDTPGAYPGAGAEERGIAGAIGAAIMEWFSVPVPVLAVIIGEGGSGGALGMGVADRALMLEHAIYSVASPEACASIVWKDVAHKKEAADQMRLTASDLRRLRVIDEVVPEPGEGAHDDHQATVDAVDEALHRHLCSLSELDSGRLLDQRYERFRNIDAILPMDGTAPELL